MQKLIDLAAIAEGEIKRVELPGHEPVAVYRVEGKCHATQDTCSHSLASLAEGWLEGCEVVCPVHEARFDIRTGKPLCFPATEPIKVFAITERDGALWI
jgi:nitrite reductase/ring-hydroxylating ferredoxin subunit